MNSEKLISAGRWAGKLKNVVRTGWEVKGVPGPESVAEHNYRATVMASVVSHDLPNIDRGRLIDMAIVEDIGEAITGDVRWEEGAVQLRSEVGKTSEEEVAVEQILQDWPRGEYYLELWREYNSQSSPEAKLLKQIDKLEMAMQALEYEQEGHPAEKLDEFWENAEKYLAGGELESVFRELQERRG